MAERLRALAQPQRLMILGLLLDGERSVGEIDAATAIGQPALSQQLAELRRAGLVSARRDARLVRYSVADGAQARVRAAFEAFGTEVPSAGLPRSPPRARPEIRPAGAAWFARVL